MACDIKFNILEFISYFRCTFLSACYDNNYSNFDVCQSHVDGKGHDHVLLTLIGHDNNGVSRVYVRFTCARRGNAWNVLSSVYFFLPDQMNDSYKVEFFDKELRDYSTWCKYYFDSRYNSYEDLYDAYEALSKSVVNTLNQYKQSKKTFTI